MDAAVAAFVHVPYTSICTHPYHNVYTYVQACTNLSMSVPDVNIDIDIHLSLPPSVSRVAAYLMRHVHPACRQDWLPMRGLFMRCQGTFPSPEPPSALDATCEAKVSLHSPKSQQE